MINVNSNMKLKILAIDTSCDDTSVAVLENDKVLSNIVSSQIDIHREWGGVVPNLAKREHEKAIDECVRVALKRAKTKEKDISAIAVTYGPGLAPALQVGVNKAKEMSLEYDIPLIGVNHIEGHILAVLLKNKNNKYYSKINEIKFPLLVMIVSGGHTQIIFVKSIGEYKVIGRTLDDAVGEAFDKVSRMLDLGYPGGLVISEMSKKGDKNKFILPRPMKDSNNYDFSFSGLKTACLYNIRDLKKEHKDNFVKLIPDYCASFQEAAVDSLLIKLKRATKKISPKMIFVGGGVSANNRLRKKFKQEINKLGVDIYFPSKVYSTDNAAMIGVVGYYKYLKKEFIKKVDKLDRVPSLSIEDKNIYE